MARNIEIGETGSYGLFPKLRVSEVKNNSIVMKDDYGGTKEVSYKLFYRFFKPFEV